jgi:methylated-DNA-[protein]-cysteine S-methyltransferase
MGTFVFATRLGWVGFAYSSRGLSRVVFGHSSPRAALAALDAGPPNGTEKPPPRWISELASALADYADGRKTTFPPVPLDLSGCTPFQRRVLAACRQVEWGKVVTYGQLAAMAGSPRAARAVGQCMARNRFPLIVPCHRVVGHSGRLGGFSAPQGVAMKRRLLRMEAGSGQAASVKPKVRGSRVPVRRRSGVGPGLGGGR